MQSCEVLLLFTFSLRHVLGLEHPHAVLGIGDFLDLRISAGVFVAFPVRLEVGDAREPLAARAALEPLDARVQRVVGQQTLPVRKRSGAVRAGEVFLLRVRSKVDGQLAFGAEALGAILALKVQGSVVYRHVSLQGSRGMVVPAANDALINRLLAAVAALVVG